VTNPFRWRICATFFPRSSHSILANTDLFNDRYSQINAKRRAANSIGNGALVYQGPQGVDNDAVSLWQLSPYGGVTRAAADG
jgi:hypothetical protein